MAMKIMMEYVNSVLMSFRGCFSRKIPFHCFVIIVVGFMLRCDYAGITTIIRTLGLEPGGYEAFVHFFAPARGASQASKNIGCAISELPAFCSQKMGCLFLSEMG